MIKIYNQDIVEVLPGCIFQSLVYSKGVVIQSLYSGMAIVRFPQKKHWTNPSDVKEIVLCTDWIIPFSKLKVLDSPRDTKIGDMEEEILSLEADLSMARSCLVVSEEMRDKQFDLIEKLVQEVDMLKAEVYHLRNLNRN